MPDVLLHIRQAQQQLQQLGALVGELGQAILGKQPDCQVALVRQPFERVGVERLALLAKLKRPGDTGESAIQIMAQTDAVPGEARRNRRRASGSLTGARLPDHGGTPRTHEFRTL